MSEKEVEVSDKGPDALIGVQVLDVGQVRVADHVVVGDEEVVIDDCSEN
jgi:predicted aspartyl protease